jgi:hypothetical protein
LLFIEAFTSTSESSHHSHSAEYQNIVTLEDERGALSSQYNSNELQWLGFGLPVGHQTLNRIKRLDCAPSSLYNDPNATEAKVRSSASLLLT